MKWLGEFRAWKTSSPPSAHPTFQPPKWHKPRPLGYGNAADSLGSVAAPLLAGFSLASVIVVSDDSANFRWPGPTIFGLSVGAVLLIGAVQFAYNARQYLWSAADVRDWWPDVAEDSDREKVLREEQAFAFSRWTIWTMWMRVMYNLGILALLTGFALALSPLRETGVEAIWRWAAVGLVFAACATEACWIIVAFMYRFWTDKRIREAS